MKLAKYSFILVTFCCIVITGFSQTTAQWRGLNRDGVYNEKQLLKSWPENGPALLWANEDIGDGYGSPVIANNMLFVNGWVDSISHVFAFDLKGQLIWKTPNGKEFVGTGFSNKFAGSRSTPTVVGDLVYACSGNGRITCLETKTGKEKWAVEMTDKFKGIMNSFGYAESILVDGDKLYCLPGNPEKNMAALNRFSGETIWTSKAMGDSVSYCSPLLIKLPARNVLVNFTIHHIFGLDAGTGELLWSQLQENVVYNQQCNTPVFADGYIYYVAGDGNGAVKLELSPDGKSIKEIWRVASIKNNFNGFVKLGNHLFTTERAPKLKCIDITTGTVIDSVKMTKGGLIAADGMLYCYSDNGEVNLIKLNGAKMEVTGKLKIDKGNKEHFAHPVIDKGVLYIRHGKALMAYDIKEI